MLRTHQNGGVVLCGKGKCCPVMQKLDNETYTITDDDGNTIKIKKDQAELINNAVQVLEGQQLLLG